MFKSYFTVGWRNLLRNQGYSIINIGGLAVGLTVAMLIGLWVRDELNYNKGFANYDRLAQVFQHSTYNGVTGTMRSMPRAVEIPLRTTYGSDFEYLSMASWTGDHILSQGEQRVAQMGNYVQEDFPEMLSLDMIHGSRKGLKDPTSILLSESAAKALFGDKDAMNQTVRLDNKADLKVIGVFRDIPFNSGFKRITFLASWELYITQDKWIAEAVNQWDNNSFQIYAQIKPTSDFATISQKIKKLKVEGDPKLAEYNPEIFLNPMPDWHLRGSWKNGKNVGGREQIVWLFAIVGVFVLLLACINFMNLSTARSEKRAKEVGIRMTIGSVRAQLIQQFLSESFIVVLAGFVIAVILTLVFLPWFNEIADKRLVMEWFNPYFWMTGLGFIFLTSLLAGSYPSLYLSSFRPASVLKGGFKAGRFASLPRKVLVVVQFTVSVTLIIGTIIVYQQIEFTKNRPMGYSQEGVVMMEMKSPDFQNKLTALQADLKSTGAVVEVTESSSPLTDIWSTSGGITWEGKDPNLQSGFTTVFSTHDYGKTVNWSVVLGRDFSREYSTDSAGIVLNESAVKFMGVKEPIGTQVKWDNKSYHVIGVTKDMIMGDPYREVKPAMYFIGYSDLSWIIVRLNPDAPVTESLDKVREVFAKLIPSAPFDYKFVDEEYGAKFSAEVRIGRLARVFAWLAIFISCLGLLGLASFVAEQRTKEIGVRKIMGASVARLWGMLSRDFVVLVIISCSLSILPAYYFMKDWLSNYEFHIEISWWVFLLATTGAVLVTMLTVSYQAVKAATMSPVKSLRSE